MWLHVLTVDYGGPFAVFEMSTVFSAVLFVPDSHMTSGRSLTVGVVVVVVLGGCKNR